ncbi:MAG TPA: type II toxin-antitoxin system ParD family antitoxin [Pirellulales bacterium]|nr:type II toxin-antitoxin system ParD family antitoxin [Pirellulales bacterium]
MTISIPPQFAGFVADELATGKYQTKEEVVTAALQLLQERERKLNALRADIQVGLDQLDRGEGIVISDEESLNRFVAGVETRGRQRNEAKGGR